VILSNDQVRRLIITKTTQMLATASTRVSMDSNGLLGVFMVLPLNYFRYTVTASCQNINGICNIAFLAIFMEA
jgi:hypothetical protein